MRPASSTSIASITTSPPLAIAAAQVSSASALATYVDQLEASVSPHTGASPATWRPSCSSMR